MSTPPPPTYEITQATTPEDIATGKDVIFRAFREYKLFAWAVEAEPDKDKGIRFLVEFGVTSICKQGALLLLKDTATNQVLGASAIAYESRVPENAVMRWLRGVSDTTGVIIDFVRLCAKVGFNPQRLTRQRMAAMERMEQAKIKWVGDKDRVYLLMLACVPEAQGKGVGGKLLDHVAALAKARSQPLYLETDEPHLMKFYTKYGYQMMEEYVIMDPQHPDSEDKAFKPNYAMVKGE